MTGLLTEDPLVETGEGRVAVVVSRNDLGPVLVAMLAGDIFVRFHVSCFTEGADVLQSSRNYCYNQDIAFRVSQLRNRNCISDPPGK